MTGFCVTEHCYHHFKQCHDDVIKWKHFPRNWPFVQGNSPVTSEFPAQRPVTQSFDVFFDLHLNKRLSKQSRGWWFETPSCPLWHHYITVMLCHLSNHFLKQFWLIVIQTIRNEARWYQNQNSTFSFRKMHLLLIQKNAFANIIIFFNGNLFRIFNELTHHKYEAATECNKNGKYWLQSHLASFPKHFPGPWTPYISHWKQNLSKWHVLVPKSCRASKAYVS